MVRAKSSSHLSFSCRQCVYRPCPALLTLLQAWVAVPTHPILWLEEALLLPPRVPGSLHILRTVGIRHDATDIWGDRRGRVGAEAGSSWEGDDGPAQKALDLSQLLPSLRDKGAFCKSSPSKVLRARAEQIRVKIKQRQLRRVELEGWGPLPPASTFLFPRWGWEVIGNYPRISFPPLLWFCFLLLGREKIQAQISAT